MTLGCDEDHGWDCEGICVYERCATCGHYLCEHLFGKGLDFYCGPEDCQCKGFSPSSPSVTEALKTVLASRSKEPKGAIDGN
jgi:hypothetical protein